jgi:hypothetical protein
MNRLDGLHWGVFAAECFEVFSEEGLDAERDAGDAEFFVEGGCALCESGRIGFEGDLFDLGKVKVRVEASEESSQVSWREHGGSASTEVDCFKGSEILLGEELGFRDESLNERAKVGFARSMLVKRAVGADTVTEGNVEI